MSLKGYGALKGRVIDTLLGSQAGHLQVLVEANQNQHRIAVNVRSLSVPPELKYTIIRNFDHPILDQLLQLQEGILRKEDGLNLGLDYIRGNFLDYRKMNTAHHIEQTDNELADLLQLYIQKAQNQKDAEIYAFGQIWGPEDKPDGYFKFKPGYGIHDIHMNQGNTGNWEHDNGTFQDGGLFLHFPKDNQWIACFFAFQSQSFHTDQNGNPLFEPDTSIEQSVRIVSALLKPKQGESQKIGLINRTNHTICLDGWHITDNNNYMQLSGEIEAGAYKSIPLKNDSFISKNGGILILQNENSQKVDGVCYSIPEAMTEDVTTVF